jgi:hypothetical protein
MATFKSKEIGITVSIILLTLLPGCSNNLYKAIEQGNESDVKKYLQKGQDINKKGKCMNCFMIGETPLEHAARYGNSGIVKLLINNGAQLAGDELCFAAGGGHVETVNLLIDNGAKVNNKTDVSFSLLNAFLNKQNDIAELLQDKGAKFPSDVASIIIGRSLDISSVDGNNDIWNSPYNDSKSNYFYKGNFLFLSPGKHKLLVTFFVLITQEMDTVSYEVTVESGSVYLLSYESKSTTWEGKMWRPIIEKIK